MKKIKMLTQDNCPKCITLKLFLEINEYIDDIEIVKREDNPKLFMALARKHGIMATPALIAGEMVLRDTSSANVSVFLKGLL